MKEGCGPDWREKMALVEEGNIKGRVTWADNACPECGIYGNKPDQQRGGGDESPAGRSDGETDPAGGTSLTHDATKTKTGVVRYAVSNGQLAMSVRSFLHARSLSFNES